MKDEEWVTAYVILTVLSTGAYSVSNYIDGIRENTGQIAHAVVASIVLTLAGFRTLHGGPWWRPFRTVQSWAAMAAMGSLAYAVHTVLIPAVTEPLGGAQDTIGDWGQSVWFFFVLGVCVLGLYVWGLRIATSAHDGSRRQARLTWSLVSAGALLALIPTPVFPTNDAIAAMPSLYATPPLLLVALLDAPWPWVIKKEREARLAAESPG